jgi:acyl-CoA reductase-like NAD-dependent aldehyde dehydrogenase
LEHRNSWYIGGRRVEPSTTDTIEVIGTVTLNGIALDTATPSGGVKQPGMGRELGPEGLAAYHEPKSIMQVPAA